MVTVRFVIVPLPAVKLDVPTVPALTLPAVKLVMELLAAVKLVAPTVPAVTPVTLKLVMVLLAAVRFVADKLTIVPLVAVKRVALTLPIVMVSPLSQVSAVPKPGFTQHAAVLAAMGAAYAFCTGKVITKPELINKVAKTLLTLALPVRVEAVFLDISDLQVMELGAQMTVQGYIPSHPLASCNSNVTN